MNVKFSMMPLLALVMMILAITSQAQAREEASAPTY